MIQPRLKDLGRWRSGGTPPRDREEMWGGTLPWLSAKDFQDGELREPTAFITEDAALAHSCVVPRGALLFIVRGMALVHGIPVAMTEQRAAFNQDVRALICASHVDPRFAYYSVIGNRGQLNRHIDRAAHGTARVTDSLYAERIRLPAEPDQHAIADFLDRECERITALDCCLTSLVQASEEETDATVAEALAELPCAPRPLAWAVHPNRPIVYGIVLPGEPADEGVLLVKGGNVERNELLPEQLVKVTPEIERRYARARLRGGDLLVTIRGSFGATAQLPQASDGANITQDTARVAPSSHVDARYLFHVLRSSTARDWMASVVRGTGVRGINIYDLRRLPIPIPDLADQRRLAAEFDVRADRCASVRDAATRMRRRLAEYRDALITEAVTGQLDVSCVTDAPMDDRAHAALEGARP